VKPLVYIAGPYMNPYPVTNTRAACECWHRLWKSGVVAPIVPHLSMFLDFLNPMPWGEWLDYDLEVVARCDAVLRLPGASPGADKETAFAESRGIPVFTDEAALLEHFTAAVKP
jgi:hypothetical protein